MTTARYDTMELQLYPVFLLRIISKETNISLDAQFFRMLIPPSPPFFPLDNRIEKKPMALVCRREIACNRHRPLTQTLNHVCCV